MRSTQKALLLTALALALVACDPIVSERVAGPARDEERETSCHHSGYCCAYTMGYNGKYDFSCKLSPYCPGSQRVMMHVIPMIGTRESGEAAYYQQQTIARTLEACH